MHKRTFANIAMLLTTMIWGASFVAQNLGSQYLGPFSFGAIRFFLGALVLLPVLYFSRHRKAKQALTLIPVKRYLFPGAICGGSLFLGALFQQYGIMYTTVGKSGFVTTLYVILVPVLYWLLYRRRLSCVTLCATLLAIVGIYLLCVNEGFSVNFGDVLCFIGAFFWALQILCIDRTANGLDSLLFSFFQFLFCAGFNAIFMLFIEHPSPANIALAGPALLYSGILSVGVGFTAQVICLKYTDATVATIIMSLESVFSVVFGFLILHEVLTFRQGIGCFLVLSAVILTQLFPQSKLETDAASETE